MNVAAVLMEILRAAGVRYLFGNPGTTELPFLDALPDSGLEYVLGLQEATAVAAADGYAQASGQVGVVNVHVAPGLANSLSILHNAARPRPEPGAVPRAVELLASARAPIIIAGDGVARARAVPELTTLAELMGARVHGEPVYRRTNIAGNHALWRGGLFPSPGAVRKALEECDALLIVGANVFTWFLHTEGAPFPRGLRVVQIDDDPWEIGRSYPVSLGIAADPKTTLAELASTLRSRMTEGERAAAAARVEKMGEARAELMARVGAAAQAEAERTPIGQAHLMHTLASLLPADAIVVDESATSLPFVLRYMPFSTPGSFYGGKTGTLGWGMGAAIGVQLGSEGRKVVATIGDGSVMYAPQALWTAAHYQLPITYVVPNNSSYAILKSGMLSLDLASAKRGIYPGMDLVEPEIDYTGLARSLGVRAERVEKPGNLRAVLAACLAHPGPTLVDVAIDRGFKAML